MTLKPPNTSSAASKRLGAYAKATGIPGEVVRALFDLFYDLDSAFGREAHGWINGKHAPPGPEPLLEKVAAYLKVAPDFEVSRDDALSGLLDAHQRLDAMELWRAFHRGVPAKDGTALSRFSSWHYLRGATREALAKLDWNGDSFGMKAVASSVFRKVFRAGSVDRGSPFFCYCDLLFPLGASHHAAKPWLSSLLDALTRAGHEAKLTELVGAMTGRVKADKHFKQTVLEALAYAGVIRVRGHDVEDLFLPDWYHHYASHHYANEWAFPLRFWSEKGGTIAKDRVPLSGRV